MLSDHKVCSEPLSKHSPVNDALSVTETKSHTRQQKHLTVKDATGGTIHFSGKVDGSGFVKLTIALSGFVISCDDGQKLAYPSLLDKYEECRNSNNLSALEYFIFRLRSVIAFANRCTKKPALVEIFDSVNRLQFSLFLPRNELQYCTRYILEEPGVLLEVVLPMETTLCKSLRSYLDALALGFFFLCHPRITFYIPALGLNEDFLPRCHMSSDEEYLNSTLTKVYNKGFIISSNTITKDDYSVAASVCISPSQDPLDHFSVHYIVVVNNTPLVGLRSPLCPTTLENLDFLIEYDISLNRLSLAEELALEMPFTAFYKAIPHSKALIDCCIITVAIYFNNNVRQLGSNISSLSPNNAISLDISNCIMHAFSECVSKFPSGLKKIVDQKHHLLRLSVKHVLTDLETLSSLLLTEEELDVFTRKHNTTNLAKAISETFSSILNERSSQ